MKTSLNRDLLSQISTEIVETFGLDFSEERWPELERALLSAAVDSDTLTDVNDFTRSLLSSPDSKKLILLAPYLTVGETYFLRETPGLKVIEEHVFPSLIESSLKSGKEVKVWSAGCSTGEEAYTIAILFKKQLPKGHLPGLHVIGTDLNENSIRRAQEAIYGRWSFRGVSAFLRNQYFEERPNCRFQVKESIRKAVTFFPLNLLDNSYSPVVHPLDPVNLILCRNVLMYLTQSAREKVVSQLYQHLSPGGWLLVGAAETSGSLFAKFTSHHQHGFTVYRKPAELIFEQRRLHAVSEPHIHEVVEDGFSVSNSPLEEIQLNIEARTSAKNKDVLAQENTGTAQSLLLQARENANQGRLEEALLLSQQVLECNKSLSAAYYLRAVILQELGMNQEARRTLEQLIYLEPDYVVGHVSLGNLALTERRFKDSQRHLEIALDLLKAYAPGAVIPESEGLTAKEMTNMILLNKFKAEPGA